MALPVLSMSVFPFSLELSDTIARGCMECVCVSMCEYVHMYLCTIAMDQ